MLWSSSQSSTKTVASISQQTDWTPNTQKRHGPNMIMIFSKQEGLLFVASTLISLCESLALLNSVYDLIGLFRGDYLRTIVNLNRSNTTWTLDPRVDTGRGTGSIEWGVGNQGSAEFNLVYRWHSAIGKKDEKWTE